MKRKITGLLIVSMIAAFLTGCGGEKVTAEDLIDNAINTDYIEYELEYCVDYSTMIDGVKDRVDYILTTNTQCNESICYQDIKLSAEYSMEVYSYAVYMEAYSELDGNNETTYAYENDVWTTNSYDVDYDSYIPSLEADMFDNLEMEENEDGYKVTGEIKDFDALLGFDTLFLDEVLAEMDDCEAKATLVFDEDGVLESFEVEIETDEDETYEIATLGDVNVYGVTFVVEIKSFEGDKVEIPDDVKEEAVDLEDLINGDTTDNEDEDESDAFVVEDLLGETTEDAYENKFFNIGFSIAGTDYQFMPREELDEVYNASLDSLGDDYAALLETVSVIYDMLVFDDYSGENVNFVIEDLTNNPYIDSEEAYAEVAALSIQNAYESMGATDVVVTETTKNYMGEDHIAIEGQYTSTDGITVYQLQSYIKCDNYMLIITASSFESAQACEDMLSYCYRIN